MRLSALDRKTITTWAEHGLPILPRNRRGGAYYDRATAEHAVELLVRALDEIETWKDLYDEVLRGARRA